MELTAAIKGLEAVEHSGEVELLTDSQYVQRGMTEWMPGWVETGRLERKEIANADLWKSLLIAASKHLVVEWTWVSKQAGDEMNKRVDELAHQAARSLNQETVGT